MFKLQRAFKKKDWAPFRKSTQSNMHHSSGVNRAFNSTLGCKFQSSRAFCLVERKKLEKHVERSPVVRIYMYRSLQTFFFKIVTIDFKTPLPMFDSLLKCFNEFGALECEWISGCRPRECFHLWKTYGISTVPTTLETTKNHKQPDPDYRATENIIVVQNEGTCKAWAFVP